MALLDIIYCNSLLRTGIVQTGCSEKVLNTSKTGGYIPSLDNLCQFLTIFTKKNIFLIFRWNFKISRFCPLSRPLCSSGKCLLKHQYHIINKMSMPFLCYPGHFPVSCLQQCTVDSSSVYYPPEHLGFLLSDDKKSLIVHVM